MNPIRQSFSDARTARHPDLLGSVWRVRILGHRVERIQIRSPFFVRSFDPRISEIIGREITGLSRIGKRIVWELEGDLFLVFHLMIAGRLRWTLNKDKGASGKILLAQFEFSNGKLQVTEASKKKRASLHLVRR